MTTDPKSPAIRVYAELPSGEYLVPGDAASCPGPDAFGACPLGEIIDRAPVRRRHVAP